MDTAPGRARQLRNYRRVVIGTSVAMGSEVGIALGSLAVLSGTPWPLAFLALPIGLRVVGRVTGRLTHPQPVIFWTWPVVALAVTILLMLLLPRGFAPLGLGVAVALWFTTVIAVGVLDVVVDPDGRLGGI